MKDHTRRSLVLAAVGTTQLIIILNGSIVNIALPSLQQELQLDLPAASWVITSYALAFGGFLLLGGRLSDRIGAPRAFLIGMTAFILSSLVVGLASSGEILIAARTAQGLGASLIAPAGLSILYDTFRDPRPRARALGVYGLMATCGGAIGLVGGGVITYTLSWRWCFLIIVPFGVAALVVVALEVRGQRGHRVRIGALPALLVTFIATSATLAVIEYDVPAVSIPAAVAACIGSAVFAATQVRARETFIPRGLFASATSVIGLVGVSGASFVMLSTGTLVSLFLQNVLGLGALNTGLLLLATPASIALGTAIGSALLPRIGAFPLILGGIVGLGVSAVLLTRLHSDEGSIVVIASSLALSGTGLGLVGMASIAAVLANARPQESGVAAAGQQMLQQLFGALGLAVLFAVASTVSSRSAVNDAGEATAAGVVATQWVAAGVTCAVAVSLIAVWSSSKIRVRASVQRSERTSSTTRASAAKTPRQIASTFDELQPGRER